jgi:hypothetical protein
MPAPLSARSRPQAPPPAPRPTPPSPSPAPAAFGDKDKARAATAGIAPLDAADVARALLWALAVPDHVEVNDIVIRPVQQVI